MLAPNESDLFKKPVSPTTTPSSSLPAQLALPSDSLGMRSADWEFGVRAIPTQSRTYVVSCLLFTAVRLPTRSVQDRLS